MNNQKILNLLGLAQRARKVTLGEEFVLKELSKDQSNLVFLASDAGENIKNKIIKKTEYYSVKLIDSFTTDELSKAIGKENRKVILVSDKGFIDKFNEYLNS
jgi:ribosomal protein L7Ae-like RNA K-turn-binding protein